MKCKWFFKHNAAVSFDGCSAFENFSTQTVFHGVFHSRYSEWISRFKTKKTISRILMFNLQLLRTALCRIQPHDICFTHPVLSAVNFSILTVWVNYLSIAVRFPFLPLFDSWKCVKKSKETARQIQLNFYEENCYGNHNWSWYICRNIARMRKSKKDAPNEQKNTCKNKRKQVINQFQS